MEAMDLDAMLRVVDLCISRVQWRLRSSSRRRLETDILALCTGLRPVVMVDYGGKMPELQEYLCGLVHQARQELTIFMPLRVLVIEDMIYMIHVKGLAEHALSSLSLQSQLSFVDLEQDPPKMLLHTEQNLLLSELVKIQKSFLSVLPVAEVNADSPPAESPPMVTLMAESSKSRADGLAHDGKHTGSQHSEFVDLSNIVKDAHITLPTLNGWLLGYPVVYLFSKESVADAVYNLSTKYLHIYKIVVSRERTSGRKTHEEELMSFTVPHDLSLRGDKESWAEVFLAGMLSKFEHCRQVWASMRLEVTECYPQAIVL